MKKYSVDQLTTKAHPINDVFLEKLKYKWFDESHLQVQPDKFIPLADDWFKSTKLNNLTGWKSFGCVDVIMGCTHFIESFILKYGWDGIQILPKEYSYYGLMGKHGVLPGELLPNVPLIISLPNYHYSDVYQNWESILAECESKNIDVHIDFAWLTVARDIEIDLTHPQIKSFAMSLSKYSLHWNRVGLRWCKQRTMDSITMFNHHVKDVNSAQTSCGAFMINNIPRDYGWDTYRNHHTDICRQLNLTPTKLINVAHDSNRQPVGIGSAISN